MCMWRSQSDAETAEKRQMAIDTIEQQTNQSTGLVAFTRVSYTRLKAITWWLLLGRISNVSSLKNLPQKISKSLVSQFDIGADKTRVALFKYSMNRVMRNEIPLGR